MNEYEMYEVKVASNEGREVKTSVRAVTPYQAMRLVQKELTEDLELNAYLNGKWCGSILKTYRG